MMKFLKWLFTDPLSEKKMREMDRRNNRALIRALDAGIKLYSGEKK